MKRFLAVCMLTLLALSLFACASASAPAEATAQPTQEAVATAAPTPEPTAEPTPSPTPEPAFIETALTAQLFSRNKVTAIVTGIRFSANYATYIDIAIENGSNVPVSVTPNGLYLNDWSVQGVLENADAIAPGETRAATVNINWVDDPNAVYMNITQISSFGCNRGVSTSVTGDLM